MDILSQRIGWSRLPSPETAREVFLTGIRGMPGRYSLACFEEQESHNPFVDRDGLAARIGRS